MKILVTGSAGFMGSHLVDYLIGQGHKVYGIDNLQGGYLENISPQARRTFFKIDLTSRRKTADFIKKYRPEIIFHLAASAHEGLSQFTPIHHTENNLISYLNLLVPAIKSNLKRIILTSCLDQETRLITSDGIKRFTEIKPGQTVYSINSQTGKIEEDQVKNVFVYNYQGKMIEYSGKRIRFLVTPNHRIFFEKRTRNGHKKFGYERAEQFQLRAFTKLPLGQWQGVRFQNDLINFDFYPNHKNQLSHMKALDFFYLLGLFIADGTANNSVTIRKTKTGLDRENFLQLARNDKGKFRVLKSNERRAKASILHNYTIRMCVPWQDKARNKLVSVLDRYNIPWTEIENGQQIRFSCHALHDYFKECGLSAYEKHIPRWAFLHDYLYLQALWEGLIDGDGYYNQSGSASLTTVSASLVRDCVELGTKLGITVNFKFYDSNGKTVLKDGRMINSKGAYHIGFGKTQTHLIRNNFRTVMNYHGKVWCIETHNGNFLAEKNGKTFFTGNSMAVYGAQKPPFSEEMPRRPEDIYGVAKAAMEESTEILSDVHNFQYVLLRPHNVYGPRQNLADPYRNVVAIFINRLLANKPFYIYGDGNQKRAFSYIDDVTPAIARAGFQKAAKNQIINVGPQREYTINYLAEIILKLFKSKLKPIYLTPRPKEVKEAYCSSDKARKVLGFKDTFSLEKGIAYMVDWAKVRGYQKPKYLKSVEIESNQFPETWKKKLI